MRANRFAPIVVGLVACAAPEPPRRVVDEPAGLESSGRTEPTRAHQTVTFAELERAFGQNVPFGQRVPADEAALIPAELRQVGSFSWPPFPDTLRGLAWVVSARDRSAAMAGPPTNFFGIFRVDEGTRLRFRDDVHEMDRPFGFRWLSFESWFVVGGTESDVMAACALALACRSRPGATGTQAITVHEGPTDLARLRLECARRWGPGGIAGGTSGDWLDGRVASAEGARVRYLLASNVFLPGTDAHDRRECLIVTGSADDLRAIGALASYR